MNQTNKKIVTTGKAIIETNYFLSRELPYETKTYFRTYEQKSNVNNL